MTKLYAISNHWNIFRKISHNISSNCWSQCIKSHCNIFHVTVHSVTKLPKFIIETPCITFDHLVFIKSFEMLKFLQMVFVIPWSGFQLLMSFLGSIGSVMEVLGSKGGMEIIYALLTSTGHFLPESAIFALILSNTTPVDFITASLQTEDQNNEWNK